MKLEEGIEILSDFQRRFPVTLDLDDHRAVKLGIEAMKRLERERYYDETTLFELLPGETEE